MTSLRVAGAMAFLAFCLLPGVARAEPSDTATAQLWIDDTTSVDPEDRANAIKSIMMLVLPLTDRRHIGAWHFYGFGEKPWRERSFYSAGFPAFGDADCGPPPTDGNDPFSGRFRRQMEEYKAACKAMRDEALERYLAARKRAADSASDAVGRHKPQSAACTAIGDLLVRISMDPKPRYVIVVTDGSETCEPNGVLPKIALQHSGTRVIFILTASTGLNGEPSETYRRRRDTLLTAAPWLTVMAPWAVDERLLDAP